MPGVVATGGAGAVLVGRLTAAGCLEQPGVDPVKQVKMMQSFAGLVRKYQNAIGEPGITVEDINSEMGRALNGIKLSSKSFCIIQLCIFVY